MKIALYSPYLDTAGGGEKYMLSIAECLSLKEKVDVLLGTHLYNLDIGKFKTRIEKLHSLNLARLTFIKAPIGKGSAFIKRLIFLKKYDFLFYLTDGSIFFSTAKNNIIHFQVPFEYNNSLFNKIKVLSWKEAIFNSKFTKNIVESNWPIKGSVIYPPVSVKLFKPLKKGKQIISVGRFFGYLKDKKHEALIETFKHLIDTHGIKDWSLHLVGGASEGDKFYIDALKNISKGFDIKFYPNASFESLQNLYGQSSIYWHATGFGEEDPKKFEHFGISTVEAMAAGCVPVVINLGGQKEIVENGISGFLWNTLEEWEELTLKVIKNDTLRINSSKKAIERSKKFSKEEFEKQIHQLVFKGSS